jgi:hypothetical protein
MRIIPIFVAAVLALGLSACGNPKPAEPSTPTAAPETYAPTNDVVEAPAANTVADPAASNAVTNATTDDPRGLPDRREAPPAGEASEPK